MNIYINGKELSATLENEKNAYEVLKPVEDWCVSNSFIIDKLIINNTEFQTHIDEEYKTIPIEEIEKIEIEALSDSEYYLSSLMAINNYLNIIVSTDSSNIEKKDIKALIDGLEWVLDSLPRVIFLCNMKLEAYNLTHNIKMIEVKLERLKDIENNSIEEIKEFFENDLKVFIKEKVITTMELILEDAQINTIIMFANKITKENALYKIGTLPSFLPFITSMLDNTVSKLQTGNDKEAFIYAEKFSRIVSFSFNILSKVAEICYIDYSKINIDNISLLDSINDFNEMMNNVLEAFANEDYISIADLLEYEIKDKIDGIMKYIPAIEEYIEKLNV